MRAQIRAGLGAALIIGAASPAEAQVRDGTRTLAIVGGVYTFNEFQGDTDPLVGIRGGGALSPHVGLEAVVDVISTGEEVTVVGYQGAIVFHLAPRKKVVPYITAGAGGITFTGGGESETRFAGSAGAGVKAFVSEGAALRFEARDRICSFFGEAIHDIHFTAGVEFLF